MANPTLTRSAAGAQVTAAQTAYLEALVQVTLGGATASASFDLERPDGVAAVVLRLGSDTQTIGLPPPASLTFGAMTVDVAQDPTAPAGRVRLTFTVSGPVGVTWWVLEAVNPAGQDTYVVSSAEGVVARVVADAAVGFSVAAPIVVLDGEPLPTLVGTVAPSVNVASGVDLTGAPAAPAVRGRFEQVAPADAAAGLADTDRAPDPVTNQLAFPASWTAPAVIAAQRFTFALVGSVYPAGGGGPLAPNALPFLDGANGGVEVRPRPRQLIVLVDRSGSMSSRGPAGIQNFEFARQAAHVWADLWVAFRQGASDRAAIAVFDAPSCGWSSTPSAGPAFQLPATGLVDLGTFRTAVDTPHIDLTSPRGCTPLGDALLFAVNALSPPSSSHELYTILLMTDGYENSGHVKLEPEPDDTGVVTFASAMDAPGPAAKRPFLTLHSLAFGPWVSDSALSQLPNDPSNARRGLYRKVLEPEQLMSAFALLTLSGMGANALTASTPGDTGSPPADTASAVYYPVEAGVRRLAFVVRWNGALAAPGLRIAFREQGTGPAGGFTALPTTTAVIRERHAIAVIDPAAAPFTAGKGYDFRLQLRDGTTPVSIGGNTLGIVDLTLHASFSTDKLRYRLGEPIRVRCDLRLGGAPVRGALVRASMDVPLEGLGTFLATKGAKYQPVLVASGDDANKRRPDPLHPKMAMLATLLRQQGLTDLPLGHPANPFGGTDRLLDDGLHGDGAADDGTYGNTFAGTDKEGTHTFYFEASGALPDGTRFTRTFATSVWVGVKVDPGLSAVAVQVGLAGAAAGFEAALVSVRPRAANGEYLGPFRGGELAFEVAGGRTVGAIVGLPDGTYRQRIEFAAGTVPWVRLVHEGEPLPARPVVRGGWCRFLWWLCSLWRRWLGRCGKCDPFAEATGSHGEPRPAPRVRITSR